MTNDTRIANLYTELAECDAVLEAAYRANNQLAVDSLKAYILNLELQLDYLIYAEWDAAAA